MTKRFFFILPVLLVLLVVPQAIRAAEAPPDLRLARHVVMDNNSGMKAMVGVVPADWRFSGQAVWDAQSMAYPARLSFTAEGPADGARFQYFPMENYNYLTGRQPGQRINGFVMLPAMSAEQYLQTFFRNARPQASDVNVSKAGRPDWLMSLMQPEVAAAQQNINQSGMQGRAFCDAADITVTYAEGGQRWEERLYLGIIYNQMVLNTQMRPEFTSWVTSGVISMRAHAGKLGAHRAEFEIIENNSAADPEWAIAMTTVGQQLIQRQQYEIQRGWQASQQMIAAKRQINESARQVIRERQESADRIARMREDSILGVDRYDSGGERLGLPSGYKHAWQRNNGEIVMTDSHLFNPNERNPGEWNELNRARP
ncbi:exported hypothetical protein [uncultured delta proteobacterium]|uniref:Uncharacterized protein n=1 Tax=uncultured delta proteobacterium TaxID=34034 RepID=A0A212KFU7_9DELT|nr:exported hypothetical protein [uncultured delta proteobacterium]